jgi:hypothetical protein
LFNRHRDGYKDKGKQQVKMMIQQAGYRKTVARENHRRYYEQ